MKNEKLLIKNSELMSLLPFLILNSSFFILHFSANKVAVPPR